MYCPCYRCIRQNLILFLPDTPQHTLLAKCHYHPSINFYLHRSFFHFSMFLHKYDWFHGIYQCLQLYHLRNYLHTMFYWGSQAFLAHSCDYFRNSQYIQSRQHISICLCLPSCHSASNRHNGFRDLQTKIHPALMLSHPSMIQCMKSHLSTRKNHNHFFYHHPNSLNNICPQHKAWNQNHFFCLLPSYYCL